MNSIAYFGSLVVSFVGTAVILKLTDKNTENGFHYTLEIFRRHCGVPDMEMWPQLLNDAGLSVSIDEMHHKHWL